MSSLARSSALQITGKFLGVFFGLGTFYILLHTFGTEGYGVFTTALTYVTFFSIIVDFGLTITTAQMIAEKNADEGNILANLFSLRLVSALLFMSLAPLSAWFLHDREALFPLIAIASATYFFGAISQMFLGVFQKRLELTTPVLAEMISRACALGGLLIVSATTKSLIHATLVFTLGAALQMLIMLAATHKRVSLHLAWNIPIWKEIVSRSWPIGISIFFNLLYLKGDILLLWAFGKSDWEIGQYGAAYKVVDILTMIPVTFMGLVLPMLTFSWTSKDVSTFTKRVQQTIDVFALIALPFVFGAWALGVALMTAIKSDLTLAGQLLWILVPASCVVFFGSLFGHAVVAVRAQRSMTWGYFGVALIGILGYTALIPPFGAWGAAYTTLLCETSIALLAYAVVRKHWKEKISFAVPKKALLGSVVMGGITFFSYLSILQLSSSPLLALFLAFILAIGSYIAVVALLKGPTLSDVRRLFSADAHQG